MYVETDGSKSIMLFLWQTAKKSSLLLVADAYCLLDMFSVLSSHPADFGLPSDLRSLTSFQSEKNREKKQKEQRAEKMTQAHVREVRGRLATPL